MKNKLFALSVLTLLSAASLCSCGNHNNDDENLVFNFAPDYSCIDPAKVEGKSLKVGAILIGDRTEGYSYAHIAGIEKAVKNLEDAGASVEVTWEYKIADDNTGLVKSKTETLTNAGNDIVVVNSYGHQYAFGTGEGQFDVTKHPKVDYISMTGDIACTMNQPNFHNAFNATYQSRYLSGYVAGLKIKELLEDGKIAQKNRDENGAIKIGYVGAFPYAEVKSGYTAYFLGIKSVLNTINEKATMLVKYVYSWWEHDAEKAAAKSLIANGCVAISQHADSTGTAEACEEEFNNGTVVYNIGYNVSLIEAAPSCSLTSATNDWSVFYTEAFYKKLAGEAIPRDWSEGYNKGAVAITKINYDCFKANQADLESDIAEVARKVRDGEIKVFDCSTWTSGGNHLTSYTITDSWSTIIGTQCIEKDGEVYYFDESNTKYRSAPYFDILIDGVVEVDQ